MKKYFAITAFSLTLAILANVTGCNNNENSVGVLNNGSSGNSISVLESTTENSDNFGNSESTPDNSENVSDNSQKTTDNSGCKLSDEAKALAAKLRQQSFIGPDGEEVVYLNDAADIYFDEEKGRYYDNELQTDENGGYILDEEGNPRHKDDEFVQTIIKFDFGYMRYARPYFYCSKDDFPDDEQLDALDKQFAELPEKEWFKIAAGDKLDCGLTVKSVEYLRYPIVHTPLIHQKVEFDGELTLEGVLFITTNTNDYLTGAGAGWLEFFPDSSQTEGLPVVSTFYDVENDHRRYSVDKYYVENDCGAYPWLVGHIDDGTVDRQSIFGEDGAARVRVTLKNLNADTHDSDFLLTEFRGEIVDIERIE